MKAADKRGLPVRGADSPGWAFAHIVRGTVGKLLLALFRVRVIGVENVPAGGAILAGNHVSYLDPALLWCASPRPAHFMAKVELWEMKWLGWALDQFWTFPVDRMGADRQAIATGTRLLQAGELVGVFPEGTRKRDKTDELGEAQGGAAFMAIRAEVPIVPVGIVGTDRAWPAGKKLPRLVKVTVRFGRSVRPEDFEGSRKEKVAAMTAEIMKRIDAERRVGREA
ncbi:MAG TPA: lysophospholipid acyltransferase family protein [Coriobacteriia bacterium]|nr:lysophospholipid acyltransferase family protein [Coriobacteriia bacterium]